MTEQFFTAGEIEILGKVVNSLGIMGSQILLRHRPELYLQAHANLRKCRKDSEELLKRLDHMARQSKDESALRIIEDLDVIPEDAAQSLHVARRCLLASAFLGHCIASFSHPRSETVVRLQDKRLN